MTPNLVSIIDRLKPSQKNFIVACVNDFKIRENFHHNILPFLPAQDALNAVSARYTLMELGRAALGEADGSLTGKRFVLNLMSLLREVAPDGLYPDEVSRVLYLEDKRLLKQYPIRLASGHSSLQAPRGVITLDHISANMWKVTATKKTLEANCNWLAENFSIY